MTNEQIDLNIFATAFFEGVQKTVLRAIEELTEKQLYQQPSPDTNSIGWIAWHMSRWKDQFASRATDEEEIWITQGWPAKFGVDPERTGQGDSLEQVAEFAPSREILLGYVEAAHQSSIQRIANITPSRFLEEVVYVTGREARPVWRSLVSTVSDSGQHAGQIAYIHGLIMGEQW